MRRTVATLLFVLVMGCRDSDATCEGRGLPDGGGGVPICAPGPSCAPCWSCQTFGARPGWTVVPGTCDAPAADARDAPLVKAAPRR